LYSVSITNDQKFTFDIIDDMSSDVANDGVLNSMYQKLTLVCQINSITFEDVTTQEKVTFST